MKNTATMAAAIAPILQSYINICGITQYVEPIARDLAVVEKIKCDLRICNIQDARDRFIETPRSFLVSNTDYRDLTLPERKQVLIYCDKLQNFRYVDVWDWCFRQTLRGHVVAVRDYASPDTLDCVCVWQSAPDKIGRIEKLFIFGGGNHAENTRS